MRTFTKLILEGFQSHSYTEIPLHPGLNVITGPSDSGKSAIIRALRWILFNEPRGSDFIRQGETSCRVTLVLDDGTEIIRERGKGKNRYVLRKQGAEMVFEGFAQTGVPEEILAAHGVKPVTFDESDQRFISIGYQLDGPFLLSESSAVRAKAIGRIGGVHILDAASRSVQKDLHTLSRQEKEWESRIEEMDEQLKEFADLEIVSGQIAAIHRNLHKIKDLEKRLELLENLDQEYSALCKRLEQVRAELSILERNDQAAEIIINIQERFQQLSKLEQADAELTEKRKKLFHALDYMQKTSGIERIHSLVEECEAIRQRGLRLQDLYKRRNESVLALQGISEILIQSQAVPRIEENVIRLMEMHQQISLLSQKEEEYKIVLQELDQANQLLNQTKGLDQVTKKIEQLLKVVQSIEQFSTLFEQKEKYEQNLLAQIVIIRSKNEELRNLSKEYRKLLQEVGKCPTCFANMTAEALNRVAREFEEGDLEDEQGKLRTAN